MWVTTKDGRHINTDWFDEKGNDKHYNKDGSYKWNETKDIAGHPVVTAGRGNNKVRISWNSTFKHFQIEHGTQFAHANSLEEAKKLAVEKFPPKKETSVYKGPSPSKSTKDKQIEQNKSEADRKNADEKYKRKK